MAREAQLCKKGPFGIIHNKFEKVIRFDGMWNLFRL